MFRSGHVHATASTSPTPTQISCEWTASGRHATASFAAQTFKDSTAIASALRAEREHSVGQPWKYGDEAFTASKPGHATAVACMGLYYVWSDANLFDNDVQNVETAQAIVIAIISAIPSGKVPFQAAH